MRTESRRPLDYARPAPGKTAARLRELLVIVGCFGVAWLVWLGIGYASYDPFDDDLLPWLVFHAVIFGTPCGAILSLIAVAVMRLDEARRQGNGS